MVGHLTATYSQVELESCVKTRLLLPKGVEGAFAVTYREVVQNSNQLVLILLSFHIAGDRKV